MSHEQEAETELFEINLNALQLYRLLGDKFIDGCFSSSIRPNIRRVLFWNDEKAQFQVAIGPLSDDGTEMRMDFLVTDSDVSFPKEGMPEKVMRWPVKAEHFRLPVTFIGEV